MNCQDAREWFSAWVDDALGAVERAQLDTHLAGCAECRRELDRFTRTVSALRAVEHPRAPVGFVDRVLAAARPAPRHRRWLERLGRLRPLRVPIGAAAVVLVATLAVYVFQRTPELQQAARPEAPSSVTAARPAPGESPRPAPVPRSAPDERATGLYRSAPGRPAPTLPSSPAEPRGRLEPARPQPEPPRQSPEPQGAARDASGPPPRAPLAKPAPVETGRAPDAPPPAPVPPPRAAEGTVAPVRAAPAPGPPAAVPLSRPDTQEAAAGPATPPPPPASTPAPTVRRAAPEQSAERDAARKSARSLAAPPALTPSAMRVVPGTGRVIGHLIVKDRPVADRELAELLSRLGGAETGRRDEGGITLVDVVVPRTAYAAFAHGLAGMGSWVADAEPADLPASIPITLRITE